MKVYIGPYRNDMGSLYRWIDRFLSKIGFSEETTEKISDFFFETLLETKLGARIADYVNSRERKIKVRIDDYDVFEARSSLAIIIIPILKELKLNSNGYSMFDKNDAPEGLVINENDLDYQEILYYSIMNEMIYAFEKTLDGDDNASAEVNERVDYGLRLFGKYYRDLWD